jgi:Amt family ammonium transporter
MMPALAFFELGLLRLKNSLSIINQVFGGLIVLGFMWMVFGFSLVFGDSIGVNFSRIET